MRKNYYVIVAVILACVFAAFLFGELFAFSPIIVGFQKFEFPNTIVYVQNRAQIPDWSNCDTLTIPVEKVLALKFKSKPEFFIFRDSLSYVRRSPTYSRLCAIPPNRILIAPWSLKEADLGIIPLDIYLKHELAHILIFQQTGFIRAFRFPKWLSEGIAVYAANQMGTGWYPSQEETYNYIRQGNFLPPRDYKTHRASQAKINVPNRSAFLYCEFACIVDYLIETRSREKFQHYIESLFTESNHDEVFRRIYGIEFDYFVDEFKNHCIIQTENFSTQ